MPLEVKGSTFGPTKNMFNLFLFGAFFLIFEFLNCGFGRLFFSSQNEFMIMLSFSGYQAIKVLPPPHIFPNPLFAETVEMIGSEVGIRPSPPPEVCVWGGVNLNRLVFVCRLNFLRKIFSPFF